MESKSKEYRFKVGDRFKFIKDFGDEIKKGQKGEITRIEDDKGWFWADLDDNYGDWSFNFSVYNNIELEESKTGGGLRYNSGKAELHQVPTSLNFAVAKCLMYGAQKYEKGNWRKGMSWMAVYDCLDRHMKKWLDRDPADEESGLPHLYHAAANIAFLIEYSKTCPELDDRFKGKVFEAGSSFDDVEYKEYEK